MTIEEMKKVNWERLDTLKVELKIVENCGEPKTIREKLDEKNNKCCSSGLISCCNNVGALC